MPNINYVQIFENRGAMMGASNPHPHCQIWSSFDIPNEVAKEQAAQAAWRERARRLPSLRVRADWNKRRASAWWKRTNIR